MKKARQSELIGIDFTKSYPKGIVVLSTILMDPVLYLISWKIDDPLWIIHTQDRSYISANDPDAQMGIYSFTPNSLSWQQGAAPFSTREEALRIRDRILRLTGEVGIVADYHEGEVSY